MHLLLVQRYVLAALATDVEVLAEQHGNFVAQKCLTHSKAPERSQHTKQARQRGRKAARTVSATQNLALRA
jgi:hypothetical protein